MRRPTGLIADIWGMRGAIALAFVMLAATLASSMVVVVVAETSDAVRLAHMSLTTIVVGVGLAVSYLVVILVAWAGSRASGVSFGDGVGLRRVSAWTAVWAGLLIAVGVRLFTGVYGIVLNALGVDVSTQTADPTKLLPGGPLGVAFTVLLVVVLAPIAEEIVFRGVLLPVISDRWGVFWGVTLSSLVFTVMHLVPYTMPPIMLLAVALSWLFFRTRSLWPAIVAHAAFNGIGLIVAYTLGKGVGL